jgi:hypothetical protein
VFNLVQLDNISSILSGVKLSSGTYDDIILHISNVTAVLNGTTENVFLPNGTLLVVGEFNISNNTTNWINLDFDLEHSIHITQNGSLVMLPVIMIRSSNDSDLQINQSSIVVAGKPVFARGAFELGMDQSGNMIPNYSTPQNWSISRVNGKIQFNQSGFIPILIRTRHELIIGGDARELFNMSAGSKGFVFGINGSLSGNEINEAIYRRCASIQN